MICPYCSTDMEPIELSGKVFCSNCGLTIKNNQLTQPATAVSQQFQSVGNVETDEPDEVQFPVVPEVAEALEQKTENNPEALIPNTDDELVVPTAPQAEVPAEPFNPVTLAAAEDLGIDSTPEVEPAPILPEMPTEMPLAVEPESRIQGIGIPSESDFETVEIRSDEPQKSYLELTNPGNEVDALNASGILLDILSEGTKEEAEEVKEPKAHKEPRKLKVDALANKPENPVEHLELEPAEEITPAVTAPLTDPKIKKQIEKIEKKIEDIPEPIVEISPEEAHDYDPDTLKSQAIKEYFSSALSEARNKPTKPAMKQKTTKSRKKLKEHGPALIFAITLASISAILLGGVTYYLIATYVGL